MYHSQAVYSTRKFWIQIQPGDIFFWIRKKFDFQELDGELSWSHIVWMVTINGIQT